MRKIVAFAVMAGLVASVHAVAAEPTAQSWKSLTSEHALLKKQYDVDKARADLDSISGGDTSLPRIISVRGAAGGLSARLIMPDGSMITVRDGTVLPDGYLVYEVYREGVILKRAKRKSRHVELSFATPSDIIKGNGMMSGGMGGMGGMMSSSPQGGFNPPTIVPQVK